MCFSYSLGYTEVLLLVSRKFFITIVPHVGLFFMLFMEGVSSASFCHLLPSPKEIYCEELTHISMEGEKPYCAPFTNWRPKKTSGIVQSEAEGLRPWGRS